MVAASRRAKSNFLSHPKLQNNKGIVFTVAICLATLKGTWGAVKNYGSAAEAGGGLQRALYMTSLLSKTISTLAALFSVSANTARGAILVEQADAYKELIHAQAGQEMYQELSAFVSQMSQQANDELRKVGDQVGQMTEGQAKFTEGDKKLAELLAAMAI